MEAALPCLLHDEIAGRFQILHALRDVRVPLGARRSPIALEIHRPDVEAVLGEDVHQRVLALAGHGEVERRTTGERRAVDEEEYGQRTLARFRRALPLAEHVE